MEKLKNHIKSIVKEMMNEENKNTHKIKLILNDISLKKFKNIPTFKNILYPNQLSSLKIGENVLTVNNTAFSTLDRMKGPGGYEVEKVINEDGSVTSNMGGYLTPRAFKKSAMNEDKTEVDVPEDVDKDLKANGFNTLNDLFKSALRPNRKNLSDNSKKWFKDVLLPAARRLKEIKKVGGGRRFIPKEFEFPSFLLEPITIGKDEPRKYFKIATNSNGESILMVDPLVKTALDTIERGRSSFSKEQSLSRLTQYLKERVPQQVRGLIKKYSSGGKIMGNGFITLSLIMNKQGDTWFVQNPNKEDNVKDDINVSLYETINEALLNEVSYNKFKKDVSYRSKTEMLHRGIKEVKRKLQEINRIVEYTSRMKQELSEGDGVQYWSRTETQLQQVAEIVNNLNEKIKNLNQ